MNTKRKKNILLVDDDPFLQSLYRKTLEREGFNVLIANDGVAALGQLPESPDLIVLDLMLPKLDGMKVLEAIRADKQYKEVPVLILSNAYLPDVAQKAMAAGATSGIMKSECSPKLLVKIIYDALKNASHPAAMETKQPAGKNSWIPSLLRGKSGSSETEHAVKPVATSEFEPEPADPAVTAEFQNELLKNWPTEIAMLRGVCLKYGKSVGAADAEDQLKQIYRRLRLLSVRAAMAEWFRIGQLSSALEAMLFEHGFKPEKPMSQSAVQTMFQAVDCLEHLFKNGRSAAIQSTKSIRILLVDDDPVCNQANDLALKRLKIETSCAGDGTAALNLLEKGTFDLILLDVEMPEVSGFDVCKKLRKLAHCKDTPVIFVTIKDDFQSRAQSVLCGGNSLISKPISPLELIVRTLIFLLRPQNGKPQGDQPAAAAIPANKAPASTAAALAQTPRPAVSPSPAKTEAPDKELQVAQAAVDEKVKALTEALAAETKRRESAEQVAAEHAKLQRKLENDQAENQKAREWLEQQLAATQAQGADPGKMDGRTRALQAVRDFVEDKSKKLTKKLVEQATESKTAEEQAAECAKRMGDFESSLASIRKANDSLLQELERTANTAKRTELESAIAENQKSQSSLVQKIEETWQEFEVHQQEQAFQQANGDTRSKELEENLAAVQEKVNALSEALAESTKRSETAEQQAAEVAQRRAALEAELATSSQAQVELRAQLSEQQRKLEEQIKAHQSELSQLAGRTKDLEFSRAEVEEKANTLKRALEEEKTRSESAENQASEIADRRTTLEAELLASKQAQAKLKEQLAEQQKQLDAQVKAHQNELGNLNGRTKELEAGRVSVEEKVQNLTQALVAESKRSQTAEQQAAEVGQRRAALEAELAASNQAQAKLQAQLAEQQQKLEAQVEAKQAELGQLAGRAKELEVSRATVEDKVKSLTDALAAESKRSEVAEQQAAAVKQERSTLEGELAASNQAQAQLKAQLAEQQQKLDNQLKADQAEFGKLSERAKELEASRVAVEEKVKALTEALAAEKKRSESAEKQSADVDGRRTALESELVASNQAQAQLRAQLAEQQQKLDTQLKADHAEFGKLNERTKELEANRAAVEEKVKALTEALAVEKKRSENAEKQSADVDGRRTALESELVASNQAQAQLRAQLAEQQKQLDAQVKSHHAELGNLSGKTKELEATRAATEEKVKSLEQALAAEAQRSQNAEKQAAAIEQRRGTLEAELAASNTSQAQLRAKLEEQQHNLTTQVQAGQAEFGKLNERAKELEGIRTTLEDKIKSLSDALATETKRAEKAERQLAEMDKRRIALESELAASNQAQSLLRDQLAEQQRQFTGQIQGHQAELAKMAERTKELAANRDAVEEQLNTLKQTLAEEARRSQSAERQATETEKRRLALEGELAASNQMLAQLRAQLTTQEQHLAAQMQAGNEEFGKLSAHTKELEAGRMVLEEKIKSLTQTLTAETARFESAGQEAVEAGKRRTALEAELAANNETQARLRTQIAEQQQQLHIVSAELEGFRRCAQDEAVRHKHMAEQIAEFEKTRTDLGHQLDSARALASSREDAINALNIELQKHRDAHERLDVSLKGEMAQRQEIEARIQTIQSQLEDASRQLAQKCTAEQGWLGRESELQTKMRTQQEELAKSKALLATQDVDIKNARIKTEESQILQTVLCAKIQVLADQNESAGKSIQELEAKAALSIGADKQLAALRYAVLDASRMNAKLQRERSQKERQNQDAVRQLLSSLVETPLSMAQRGMLTEIQNSMDGLLNRAGNTQIVSCPVEMPVFRQSEFRLAEITESAFVAVRAAAKAAGVTAHAAAADTMSSAVIGFAEHIHQLITLLAVSPLTIVAGINACDLRVEIKPGTNARLADLTLRVALTTDNNAQDLLASLTSVTAAAFSLETAPLKEPELGLAAGWQLALAMGAQPVMEVAGVNKVCLVISVPLGISSQPAAEKTSAKPASNNTNGHNGSHHGRKAKAVTQKINESCAVTE